MGPPEKESGQRAAVLEKPVRKKGQRRSLAKLAKPAKKSERHDSEQGL
jgi:hypothetical protein